jgi:hypothetical protein
VRERQSGIQSEERERERGGGEGAGGEDVGEREGEN